MEVLHGGCELGDMEVNLHGHGGLTSRAVVGCLHDHAGPTYMVVDRAITQPRL